MAVATSSRSVHFGPMRTLGRPTGVALVKVRNAGTSHLCQSCSELIARKVDATLEVTNAFEGYDLNDAIQFAQAYEIALRAIGAEPPEMNEP